MELKNCIKEGLKRNFSRHPKNYVSFDNKESSLAFRIIQFNSCPNTKHISTPSRSPPSLLNEQCNAASLTPSIALKKKFRQQNIYASGEIERKKFHILWEKHYFPFRNVHIHSKDVFTPLDLFSPFMCMFYAGKYHAYFPSIRLLHYTQRN
jgi:hypothetical protein